MMISIIVHVQIDVQHLSLIHILLEGKVCNNSKIRIIRDNIVLYEGQIESLRRFKDDVKEVATGYECGITIDNYRDFKEGDILEVYDMEEIPQK